MQVLFVAAECEPWAKTGGLGDVVDALARAVGRIPGAIDGPAEVFLPRYSSVPIPIRTAVDALEIGVPDPMAPGGVSEVTIRSFDADGYRLRLVDHPPAFDRPGFYGDSAGDYPDNPRRFALLGRAALETRRAERRPVDLVAIHDWQACPVALLRDLHYTADPFVGRAAISLTIHNLAYHGWTPRDRVGQLGLCPAAATAGDAWGIDLLREGIRRAETVNTVSPTYAREILGPAAGMGLDGDLAARGDRFSGILNGLDQGIWSPATDATLAAPYDATNIGGKAACRADLLARVGLDPADPSPVLGVIGRLDPQKGFDLVAGAARRLVVSGARLVVLGSGDASLLEGVRAEAARSPGRIAVLERFDRELSRRIYAGADLFLMPSRFEPCGQGQMIAMRYGTPPVARRTGGLADTIIDLCVDPAGGTGFLFDDATPEALAAAVERALRVFTAADRGPWQALVARAMAVDWAWESSPAPLYAALFRRAVALRRDALGQGRAGARPASAGTPPARESRRSARRRP
jgi:starch synthase